MILAGPDALARIVGKNDAAIGRLTRMTTAVAMNAEQCSTEGICARLWIQVHAVRAGMGRMMWGANGIASHRRRTYPPRGGHRRIVPASAMTGIPQCHCSPAVCQSAGTLAVMPRHLRSFRDGRLPRIVATLTTLERVRNIFPIVRSPRRVVANGKAVLLWVARNDWSQGTVQIGQSRAFGR